MNAKQRLEQRRAMLLSESALQRTLLVAQSRQLGMATGMIKSGQGWLGRLKHIPGWVGLVLSAVMIFVPGKAATFTRTALTLMQLLGTLRNQNPDKET